MNIIALQRLIGRLFSAFRERKHRRSDNNILVAAIGWNVTVVMVESALQDFIMKSDYNKFNIFIIMEHLNSFAGWPKRCDEGEGLS